MSNATLIKVLTSETQSLKKQYLEMTEVWAKERHEIAKKMAKWREADWCKFLCLEPQAVNAGRSSEFMGFPKGFFNTRESKVYRKERDYAIRTARKSIDEYVSEALKKAEYHYTFSIEKLAFRIEGKGLNLECLKVKTSHISQNIETILTDGIKTVRAFTIVARGEIQCPHYRYLIK